IKKERVLLSKINERIARNRKHQKPPEKVAVAEVKLKKQKITRKHEELTDKIAINKQKAETELIDNIVKEDRENSAITRNADNSINETDYEPEVNSERDSTEIGEFMTNSIKNKRQASEELTQNILEAFPRFEIPKKTATEMAISKRLGITDWIAYPLIVDPEKTIPVDKKDDEGDERLGLSEKLIARCKALGITEFFAVQLAVIPILLSSRSLLNTHHLSPPGDICVSAPTGSGKTLAYVLPIIEILSKRIVTRLRALVVLPTRDLVTQVKETFEAFCKGTDLKIGVITGQTSFASEQAQIIGNNNNFRLLGGFSKIDILIATPGRLIDHLAMTPNFTLQHLRFLIIDEADRLLNQSYQDWLSHVLKAIRSCTQTQNINNNNKDDGCHGKMENKLLQSQLFADYDISSSDFLREIPIHDAVCSATNVLGLPSTDISDEREPFEYMIITSSSEKPLVVLHLLHNYHISAALCFTKSVESAHRLSKLIQFFEASFSNNAGKPSDNDNKDIDEKQIVATEYSSDLSKKERIQILNKFKAGKIHMYLIARGIDLDCVDTVINYDVPLYMKKYVHRVGRTARAGRAGEAYSLIETQEARHFKEMLKKANHLVKVKKINVKHELLVPMEQAYQHSLNSLKNYMTRGKSSVINYQRRVMVNEADGI
ncbi:11608_t:CDS:10, partial [Ambispora gerdemannii]